MQNQKKSKNQRNPKPHSLVQNPRNRMEEGRAGKYSHMSNLRNAIEKGKQNLMKTKKHLFTLKPRDHSETVNIAQTHSNHTEVVSSAFKTKALSKYF